ncbi:MAG: RagB/SusD family nutrient uptake outer membrane protein [Muribaculaceae bacterium]|nr:RagB/SusD family nutrient uptake outer membrane protein [Muribaculaceae bacterium]
MKTKIYLSLVAAGALLAACNDLDQMPMGAVATESQKEENVKLNPGLAAAAVNSLPAQVNSYMTEYETHQDYGWSSMLLMLDMRGQDMPSDLSNYQHYTAAMEFSDFGGRYYDNLYYWNYSYNIIRSANMVVGAVPESDNPELKYFRANGLAFRAFAYFNLAQMYQFTYAKNPNALCVPLILDTNMTETATEGCARSTVGEVYDQINSDLTEAIRLFEEAAQPSEEYPDGVTRETMSESANIVKTYADAMVAYGLRARANLFRCEYAAAAADAAKAIELARDNNMEPYSRADVSVPAFTNLNDKSFMWGMYADESQSEYRGVVNWASHLTGWQTNGYAAAGVYRRINALLYGTIEASDVRRGWWLDGTGKAPASLPGNYATYVTSGATAAGNAPFPPYAQLKFGSPGDTPTASGAIPTPLMRVEEMYLILAESLGYTNPADGAKKLVDFVKGYRNENYNFNPANFEALQEEVWRQRRIELWGEGFAFHDLMRLQKGVNRIGGGFPASVVFNLSPDNTCLLFDIPQSEIQRNPLIVNGTNNSVIPQPVADE